jgi:signal-transduction protein with cAMP-binding, CBS, and nucleotidyltransferase domain
MEGTQVSLDEGASVREAAERMAAARTGSLTVLREGAVVGLFTEQDLVRRVVAAGLTPAETQLGSVCTRNLISVPAECNCLRAIATMRLHRCRRLLVYRGGTFLGVATLTDLAHAIARQGGIKDTLASAFGLVTVAVAVGVIALLLFQLPEMMELGGHLGAPR